MYPTSYCTYLTFLTAFHPFALRGAASFIPAFPEGLPASGALSNSHLVKTPRSNQASQSLLQLCLPIPPYGHTWHLEPSTGQQAPKTQPPCHWHGPAILSLLHPLAPHRPPKPFPLSTRTHHPRPPPNLQTALSKSQLQHPPTRHPRLTTPRKQLRLLRLSQKTTHSLTTLNLPLQHRPPTPRIAQPKLHLHHHAQPLRSLSQPPLPAANILLPPNRTRSNRPSPPPLPHRKPIPQFLQPMLRSPTRSAHMLGLRLPHLQSRRARRLRMGMVALGLRQMFVVQSALPTLRIDKFHSSDMRERETS